MNSNQLYSFLKKVLPFNSFSMFMHILTEPYLSMLVNLPRVVRETSEIFLDGEKYKINNYAVKTLRSAGYSVYYVNRLHGKVIIVGAKPDYIIVGTSNLSLRSFTNYEAIVIIKDPERELYESLVRTFIKPVRQASYIPDV